MDQSVCADQSCDAPLTGARAVLDLYLPYATKEFARALLLAFKHADAEA
jgi:hypothetical protein